MKSSSVVHRLELNTCEQSSSHLILVSVAALMSTTQNTYECLCVKIIKGTLFMIFSRSTSALVCP